MQQSIDLDRIEELLDLDPEAVDREIIAWVGTTVSYDGRQFDTAALLTGRLVEVGGSITAEKYRPKRGWIGSVKKGWIPEAE